MTSLYYQTMIGRRAVDSSGESIGKIGRLYLTDPLHLDDPLHADNPLHPDDPVHPDNPLHPDDRLHPDDQRGEPAWVTIDTGLFGKRHSVAPTKGSRIEANTLVLAVSRDAVLSAPVVQDGETLASADLAALNQHYLTEASSSTIGDAQLISEAEHAVILRAQRPLPVTEEIVGDPSGRRSSLRR